MAQAKQPPDKPLAHKAKIVDLIPDDKNANKHTPRGTAMLDHSIGTYGLGRGVLVDRNGKLIGGNATQQAAIDAGLEDAIIVETDGNQLVVTKRNDIDLDTPRGRELAIFDNRVAQVNQVWDGVMLAAIAEDGADLRYAFAEDELIQIYDEELASDNPGDMPSADPHLSLAERFIVPPFSVLDARQGYWQERKRAWIRLGIRGELGRGNENLSMSHPETTSTIDFYKQKRELEAEVGHELSKDEAAEIMASRGTLKDARADNAERLADPETASLKGGLTFGTSIHPYDETGKKRNSKAKGRTLSLDQMRGEHVVGVNDGSRRAADQASNLNHAPKTPDWATSTGTENMAPGTSIFDPVMCELVCRWFCTPGGHVLDPFTGGSTAGIVASYLGYNYTGVDIRAEQVEANVRQAEAIGLTPKWLVGDSADLDAVLPDGETYDLIFTSPPYYDLEKYSDIEADLSAFETYDTFMAWYKHIFELAIKRLKNDRFLVLQLGEIRDKRGIYRNFIADSTRVMVDLGLAYYNEAILITAVGSLPIRVGRQFSSGRKLGKEHQNILCFFKGDPRTIKANYPPDVEVGDLSPEDEVESPVTEE